VGQLIEAIQLFVTQAGAGLFARVRWPTVYGVMVLSFSLAAGTLAWLSIQGVSTLFLYLKDRHSLSAWYRKFEEAFERTKEREEATRRAQGSLLRKYLPLMVSLPLALLMKNAPLMALYIVGLGVYFSRRQGASVIRQGVSEEMYRVMERFTSAYKLGGSTFQILDSTVSRIAPGVLQSGFRRAIDAYYVGGRTPQQVLNELAEEIDDYYLRQFVFVLTTGISATREVTLQALSNLLERMRRQRALQAETRTTLALLHGECRFLGVACCVGAGITIIIPTFRTYYASGLFHQLLWCGVTLVPVVAWNYFNAQVVRLKRQML